MEKIAREHISSAVSTATLDLKDILSSFTGDCLVSLRLSLAASDSTHSFDDVPPFALASKSLVLLADYENSARPARAYPRPKTSIPDYHAPRPLVTSPITPHYHSMTMDKVSAHNWNGFVKSPDDLAPSGLATGNDDLATDLLSWLQGDPVPSSEALFRYRDGGGDTIHSSFNGISADSAQDVTLVDPIPPSLSMLTSAKATHCTDASGLHIMPTIMVSNSTASLQVCLESTQNLGPEVSLAVRRGRKPLPALSLTSVTKSQLDTPAHEVPYPDIPSAFLGSPTCQSPTCSFSYGDPSKYNMGLSAMCNGLKALVPPPPFTPTLSPRSRLEPEMRWGMVHSTQVPLVDDDEWAFAQDLVVDWHASRGLSAEISPPPSPAGDLPYTADVLIPIVEGLPLSPTESPKNDGIDDDEGPTVPACVKQMRRKTVIIQAPDFDTSDCDVEKMRKIDKGDRPLPGTADQSVDLLSGEFEEPVPFETPVWALPPTAKLTDVANVPCTRPVSTTSAKLPVRGILKEKKCVRFSSVPSLHEYEKQDHHDDGHSSRHDDIPDRPATPSPDTPASQHLQAAVPMCGQSSRKALTAPPRKSSPLRECHSPLTPHSDTIASPASIRPRLPAPSPLAGNTMAKHPAVRALARQPKAPNPSNARSGPATTRVMGSGVGGAVVGAPGLQSPTLMPMLLEAQRRAPLKSINARQSLPKERKPDVLIPIKATPATRKSQLSGKHIPVTPCNTENVHVYVNASSDRLRTASAPAYAKPRQERDENAWRRSEGGAKGSVDPCGREPVHAGTTQKSRMPVPLRSIFTKLRT